MYKLVQWDSVFFLIAQNPIIPSPYKTRILQKARSFTVQAYLGCQTYNKEGGETPRFKHGQYVLKRLVESNHNSY